MPTKEEEGMLSKQNQVASSTSNSLNMPGPNRELRKKRLQKKTLSYFATSTQVEVGKSIRKGTATGKFREQNKTVNWELDNLGSISPIIWLCAFRQVSIPF
jgi:hypothetical protein